MNIERVHRVVYVETVLPEDYLRPVLNECGIIIYPWNPHPNKPIFEGFVEFEHISSVNRVMLLNAPGIQVCEVTFSPEHAARFSIASCPANTIGIQCEPQAVASISLPTGPRSSIKSSVAEPKRKRRSRPSKPKSSRSSTPCGKEPFGRADSCALTPGPTIDRGDGRPAPRVDISCSIASARSVSGLRESHQTSPSIQPSGPATTGPPASDDCVNGHLIESCNGTNLLAHISSQSPAVSGEADGSFCGGAPEAVELAISSLRQTARQVTDRGRWMSVACQYRSKGNIVAAINVISAMVDEYLSPAIGMKEDEMKPAFLMLASCHNDLAKHARYEPSDGNVASIHATKAKVYIQKVYGKNEGDLPNNPSYSGLVSLPEEATISRTRAHTGPLANTTNVQGVAHPLHSCSVCSSRKFKEAARIHALERQLSTSQDRLSSNATQLADIRSAKRKLEDDLDDERRLRRRVQNSLDHTEKELFRARRGEMAVLEQCKQEVESRRNAEGRAAKLRDELSGLRYEVEKRKREKEEKDNHARECFGRLGTLFLKASRGELATLSIPHTLTTSNTENKNHSPSLPRQKPMSVPRRDNGRGLGDPGIDMHTQQTVNILPLPGTVDQGARIPASTRNLDDVGL